MRLVRFAAVLVSLALGVARAAVPTVTITGSVLTPGGGGAVQGTVHARLSQAGTALDGAVQQRVAGSVLVNLTAAGALPAGFALVPNEAITPAGTYYEVTLTTRTALGERQVWTERWQLTSSPSSIAIGDVPRLDVVPGVAVGLVPATATVTGGIRLTGDLGGTATAPTVANATNALVTATGSSTARALRDIAADLAAVRVRSARNAAIGLVDVSAARAEPAQSPLTTPVPYVGSEFVHPDVLYFAEGWNGYRFWMAITPFHNGDSQYENPSIYASQDGQSWVTPAGLTNPVIPYPGSPDFNADPCLVDGLDGRLYMYYKVAGNASTVQTRVTWSSDGVTWSTPVTAISEAVGSGTTFSPSVMFDGRQWVMYHMSNPSAPTIKRRTASSALGPWSAASAITITSPPGGKEYWHQTAIMHGGRVLMLIAVAPVGISGGNGDLYLAWSDDGATFTRATNPVLAHDFITRAGGQWHQTVYRAAFAVIDDGMDSRIAIWYTAFGTGVGWKLGYTDARLRRDTTADVLSTTDTSELRAIRAAARVGPGVVFDAFQRPDSATGLGIAPTGQVWTASSGTWGIASGRGYAPSVANNIATISVAADVRVGMQVSTYAAGVFLVWRYQDASNFFRLGTVGTLGADATYYVQRVQTSATTLATGIATASTGDWVEVETSGSAISVYVNGRLAWTGTDSYLSSVATVGIQTASTSVRLGAFFAQSLVLPAITAFQPRVISSSSAPPTAGADYRGVIWMQRGGAGVKDTVQVCAKDAGDAYAWRTIY